MSLADQIGTVVGFLLTLMVISYLVGDNALFRLAVHVFIGVAAGFTTVIVVNQVIWQQTLQPIINSPLENLYLTVPPLLLGIWLLLKGSPRVERLGNPVVAFLVGVGAATAIGGAIFGTLFPQVEAAMNSMDLQAARQSNQVLLTWFPNAVIGILATGLTLGYFQFHLGKRSNTPSLLQTLMAPIRNLGQGVIAITFGVLFAGVLLAAVAAMIGRIYFVWDTVWDWVSMFIPMQ
ncbi:MAG: hypothetical protein MUC85_01245 [Anaerolineales bacterium]|jgi:hypothetical protein|nr:hypothetical protein [Anaerolineales bacterium]